jgi:DNA-binding NtrC family response regulator
VLLCTHEKSVEEKDFSRSKKSAPTPSLERPHSWQDDEEIIREVVCAMLTSLHYECRAVASPTEAVDILSSGEEFELVFCGLLESLEDKLFERMGKEFPDIPVVVASGCHDVSVFLRALRNGAYDYLPRPFERAQLSLCVQRALEYRRLKLENL